MYSTRYSCPILIKLEFSRQVFEKYSSTKLYENPTSGNPVFLGGETDRQDKANSRFSQLCKRAQKWSGDEKFGTSSFPFTSIYCKF